MSELRQHRNVLIAACAGVGFSIAAIPPFVLSVFAGPMTRELGWTLQQYQTAGLFIPVGVLIAAPLGGWLLDRYGARRVAMGGLAAFAASVAGFSLVTRDPWTFYAAMLILTLAAAGVLPTTWTRIVNGVFDRQRGIALGIALSGSGVFATFGPTLAQTVIDSSGWRVAWLVLAALPLLIALPLVTAFVRLPGELPKTAANEAAQAKPTGEPVATSSTTDTALTPRAITRSRRFWTMILSYGLVSLSLGGFNANLVPILASEGLPMADAARVAGTLGLSLIVGRLVAGALIDRFPSPRVAAGAFSLPMLGAILLMGDSPSTAMLIACVALMGFAAGAEYDILAFMTARFFGLQHYGKIYAAMLMPISVATSGGAVLFGRIRDTTGSFEAAWPVALVLCGLGAALQLTLGRDRPTPGG
ncbi:MAG: MFS transporter [Gammaproteobacteria bacterium]|nr:MFS transporter [Gammaproteobacteria bacterium]